MKIEFLFIWCEKWQKDFNCPKGYLLIKPAGPNVKNLAEWLNKLTGWQNDKQELRPCNASFEVHYKKRTLEMNSLMWSLYQVEATEQNGGIEIKDMTTLQKSRAITPESLYRADIEAYSPVVVIIVPECQIEYIRAEYRHRISEEKASDGNIVYKAYFSTSHMDTKQHGEWIERQFARLSEMGVHLANASAIGQYWVDYAAAREPDTEHWYTAEEYKAKQPFCEAEPTIYLGNGGGSLAHIVARGMGRNPMEGRYHEADVMHLSDAAHALWDNGKGRRFFLTKYPHLKKKIEAALNREIDTSQQDLFEDIVQKEANGLRKDIPLM